MFDLGKDPFQMRNVAADPKYAEAARFATHEGVARDG
jgi:hypothetical protein